MRSVLKVFSLVLFLLFCLVACKGQFTIIKEKSHGGRGLDEGVQNYSFVTVWKTNNSGSSSNNQISLPLVAAGSYDFIVEWGDGKSDEVTSHSDAAVTHTYDSPGEYTVRMTGEYTHFVFNNSGDKDKILETKGWGPNVWGTMENAFYGCQNLTLSARDNPNLSQVDDMSRADVSRCNKF